MRWRGSNIRTSSASSSSTTRPTRRCGVRSRSTARRSASASSSCARTTSQGFKAGALRLALDPHRGRRRDHRRARRRLRRAPELAQGPGAGVRRCQGRHDPGAAGPSRRRAQRHASRHERRICRLLRHRHGAAERKERHHRPRHHVPHPPLGAGRRRQLVERHDLRGHRSRPDHPRARLHRALHQPPLRLRPAARQLSRLQAPARPLGLRRLPDHEEALAPLPAGPQPAHAASRSANSRSAGCPGSAPRASACWSRCST